MSMIQPVSGLRPSAVQPPAAAGVNKAPEVQRPEAGAPVRPQTPVVDEYVPEQKREPSGLYWLGKDKDGQPKIYFDDPERDEAKKKELEGKLAQVANELRQKDNDTYRRQHTVFS